MLEARQGKEIVLRMKSRVGLLFEVSKLLAEKGVSILAVNGAVNGEECVIRLVTDDLLRTKEALLDRDYDPQEESVILLELPHKPGILKHISDALTREDIDICHLYATALDRDDDCLLVLHTANDEHAFPALNRAPVAVGGEGIHSLEVSEELVSEDEAREAWGEGGPAASGSIRPWGGGHEVGRSFAMNYERSSNESRTPHFCRRNGCC